MKNPSTQHLRYAKRVLGYLVKTATLGLKISQGIATARTLSSYSDADWANDTATRKSTTGGIIQLSGNSLIWFCKRQSLIALSTTEAEYLAINFIIREAKWVSKLLLELGFSNETLFPLRHFTDSQAALQATKNQQYRGRTKHLDVKLMYCKELYSKGLLDLQFVSTKEMLADLLTKALPAPAHRHLTHQLLTAMDDITA